MTRGGKGGKKESAVSRLPAICCDHPIAATKRIFNRHDHNRQAWCFLYESDVPDEAPWPQPKPLHLYHQQPRSDLASTRTKQSGLRIDPVATRLRPHTSSGTQANSSPALQSRSDSPSVRWRPLMRSLRGRRISRRVSTRQETRARSSRTGRELTRTTRLRRVSHGKRARRSTTTH